MNREIKFRAKKNKDNSWVYGLLTNDMKGHYRINFDAKYFSCIVKSETIGQFSGMRDKNKKEIYEGDILKDKNGLIYIVEYQECYAAFALVCYNDRNIDYMGYFNTNKCFEVIGNIHDNKELLED